MPASPVLVTGANGFIATHLCRALRAAGCAVRGLILDGTDPAAISAMGVEVHTGDILRPDTLAAPVRGARTVFHLAALARDWGRWADFWAVNAEGTRNVLEAAAAAGVERLVHMSSLAVHPFSGHLDADEQTPATNRINGYCASKAEAERMVAGYQRAGRLQATVIRPGAVILGPGDTTTFDKLAPYLERGRLVLIDKGRQTICYSYVENLAGGMLLAAARPEGAGETFIITDDLHISMRALMTAACEALDVAPRFGSVPALLARAGGWTLEMLWRLGRRPNPPPVHRYRVGIAARDFHFSCEKAKRMLGYQPRIPLDEGLARTASWYRTYVSRTVKGGA